MVHALEEIHRLLKPAGTLIEIHPVRRCPAVRGGEVERVAVVLRSAIRCSTTRTTFATPTRRWRAVLDRGVFVLDDRRGFELRTYAASVKELRDHWALVGAYDPEEPEETLVRRRDEMYARAEAALDAGPGMAEVVYVEPAQMSRLVPPSNNRLAH